MSGHNAPAVAEFQGSEPVQVDMGVTLRQQVGTGRTASTQVTSGKPYEAAGRRQMNLKQFQAERTRREEAQRDARRRVARRSGAPSEEEDGAGSPPRHKSPIRRNERSAGSRATDQAERRHSVGRDRILKAAPNAEEELMSESVRRRLIAARNSAQACSSSLRLSSQARLRRLGRESVPSKKKSELKLFKSRAGSREISVLDEFEIDDGVRELAEEQLASRLISADAAQEYGNDDIIIADETILSPASPM